MDIGNCKLIQLLGKVPGVRLRFYFKELFLLTRYRYKRVWKSEELATAANKSFLQR